MYVYMYVYIYMYVCMYICMYVYTYIHVLRPTQDSSVWLGLTSREQLISPECSKHHVLSLAKMLVVNEQNIFCSHQFLQSAQ